MMVVNDHQPKDPRQTRRRRIVIAGGIALALFATALAVAVHTGRFGGPGAAAAGRAAGLPPGAAFWPASLVGAPLPAAAGARVPDRSAEARRALSAGHGDSPGATPAAVPRVADLAPLPMLRGATRVPQPVSDSLPPPVPWVGAAWPTLAAAGRGGALRYGGLGAVGGAAAGGSLGGGIPGVEDGTAGAGTGDAAPATTGTLDGQVGAGAAAAGAGDGSPFSLPFVSSAIATLPGATTPMGARPAGFDSAAGETGQAEVPEPATPGMLAIGLAGLGLARRRRVNA